MILLKLWLLLTALLKAFGAHETEPPPDKTWKTCENDLLILDKKCQTLLICYQSKFAKDIGNLKAGGRFKVKNSVNKGFAYECAGNDGTKGWHAVRISNDNTGIVTLDASFSNKPLIVNASKYAKINITKALTSYGQAVGVDFLKAIHFGAFMIDFDCMQFQIAALEIRQFIGKKDLKLCKTKVCAAKWAPPTETPKDFLTVKLSTTQISTATTTTPVMPKAHHLNHLGINCMQIEFPMGTPSFSLNISASAYVLACEEYEKQYKDYPKNFDEKMAFLDRANACAQVPTSKCIKSVETLVCYRSKSQSTDHRNSILAKCQRHLGKASNVAGIRVQICIHREAVEQILVVESTIGFSFSEKIHNSTRKFSIKPAQTPETAQALTRVPFPFFFIEFGNERHSTFIADKAGGINTSSNWDKENAIIATVLNSIADVQINGSWTKTLHFVPPPSEYVKIFFQLSRPEFTIRITRRMDLPQYLNNPNKTVLSRCEQLGDDCEPIRQLLRKIDEMREWCSPFSLSEPCIGRRRTPPTPDDLKPFKRPSWDKTDFPSTEIPRIDEKTDDDPLDDGDDVLVTKQQAQTEYDQFMEACAKCRNSSKMEKEKRRQKRQFLIGANKWTKFPIPIRFDTVSFGDGIKLAKAAIKGAVTNIMENTCVRFTFDKFNEENGIEIMDNGNPNICGQSPVGQTSGWQQLSLNCRDMSTASHELLHALGLHHEHQRNDGSSYIKLNPLEKENAKKTENHGFPYDFGSRMHGGPGRGAHNTYRLITLNRFYQQTIGQGEGPSFKDFAIINYIYCNSN